MSQSTPGWLVVSRCGWGRAESSERAANAVSRPRRQLAEVGTRHTPPPNFKPPEPSLRGDFLPPGRHIVNFT
jgi:hypothetical protein